MDGFSATIKTVNEAILSSSETTRRDGSTPRRFYLRDGLFTSSTFSHVFFTSSTFSQFTRLFHGT